VRSTKVQADNSGQGFVIRLCHYVENTADDVTVDYQVHLESGQRESLLLIDFNDTQSQRRVLGGEGIA